MSLIRAVLAAVAVLVLTACAATPPEAAHHVPVDRTLWHVIDDRGTPITGLADDDPTVTAVRKTVTLHSGAVDNRDSATVDSALSAEYGFYAANLVTDLTTQNHRQRTIDLFTENNLTTTQTSVAWYQSTFYKDMRTAKVTMESTIKFTTASKSFLAKNDLALNTPYTQRRTVSLTREGDAWKITAIEKFPLTK